MSFAYVHLYMYLPKPVTIKAFEPCKVTKQSADSQITSETKSKFLRLLFYAETKLPLSYVSMYVQGIWLTIARMFPFPELIEIQTKRP